MKSQYFRRSSLEDEMRQNERSRVKKNYQSTDEKNDIEAHRTENGTNPQTHVQLRGLLPSLGTREACTQEQ